MAGRQEVSDGTFPEAIHRARGGHPRRQLGALAKNPSHPREIALAAVGKRIDLHLPRVWTPEDNPATRPHETEPYDVVTLEGYVPESTPWRPKWEDQGAGTVEDWELTVEGLPLSQKPPCQTRQLRGRVLTTPRAWVGSSNLTLLAELPSN